MSESGRLSRKLDEIRRSCALAALAAARAGAAPCVAGDCGSAAPADLAQKTPLESDYLDKQVRTCYSGVIGRTVGPESRRILAHQEQVIMDSMDPTNPDTRFSQYRGPFIPPVCPPVPQIDRNANVPRQSLSRCPLPNKGYMPNLPA